MASALAATGCSKKGALQSAAETENVQADAVTAASSIEHQHTGNGRHNARRMQMIYKMSGDYAALVPVTLNERGELSSYPDPKDLSEAAKPVALGDGWYLDNRGIGPNTAFLDYTYEQYQALPAVPTHEVLMAHIKVRNAITDLWNCGTQTRTIEQYKALVAEGFPSCKKIK